MDLHTVSVIVPVYNVEEYIAECIDSLVKQSLNNMQIIIVDDGSTDGSLKICKSYAQAYEQIEVIPIKHSGVAVAQQTGLNYSNGKYVAFLGADDYVSYDMYEKMWNEAELIQADIVECNYRLFWENGNFIDSTNKYIASKLKNNKNFFLHSGAEAVLRRIGYAWRIHRRKFLMENSFCFKDDIAFAEDYIWHFFPVIFAKKYSVINHVGYFYRQRIVGNQSNSDGKKLLDIEKAFIQADSYLVDLPENYLLDFYIQYEIRIAIFVLNKLTREYRNAFYNILSKRWEKWIGRKYKLHFTRSDSLKTDIIEFIVSYLRILFFRSVVKENFSRSEQILSLIVNLSSGGILKSFFLLKRCK